MRALVLTLVLVAPLVAFAGEASPSLEDRHAAAVSGSSPTPVEAASFVPPAAAPSRREILKAYGRLPLQFEANLGQTDAQVKFLARGAGYTLFLTPSEAVLVLPSPPASERTSRPSVPGPRRRARGEPERTTPAEHGATVVRLNLVGANPEPEVAGLEPLPGTVNYFIGQDSHRWRTQIPTYAKVRYRGVYPGVDVVYYGAQRQLEYDFVVAPGADPARIRLAVTGADSLRVDAAGDLVVRTSGGTLRLQKPLIYQEVNGGRRPIAGGYVLSGTRQVGLRVAGYDASRPLIIDPVLSYSTYLGGSSFEEGNGIAVDSAGNAYVTGYTFSTDFPTVNALQPTCGGCSPSISDAFVAKLNAAGSALVYATYLGGSVDDEGWDIAVDSAGNAYVTGHTYSTDFPTVNALQPTCGCGPYAYDAFVAKLNAAGSALVYSTYLGGRNGDFGRDIAVDSAGAAYVTGGTYSTDFPTVNALQPTCGGCSIYGYGDAFVAKLHTTGSALVYSTYLGGTVWNWGTGIAVDSAGNAYVTGDTFSTDFPMVNALQPTCGGCPTATDAFVAKLNAAGSALVYSTYLGGSGWDSGGDIAVDSAGNAYVTGGTGSADFPTVNALQPTCRSCPINGDAFVAKLDPAGSALVYSTYLGGSGSDSTYGIAVDSAGNAYVTGYTDSTDFPTMQAFQPTCRSCSAYGYGDAFVAKLDPAGSALVYSTYLGGNNWDWGRGIAVDDAGTAYVAGTTSSTDFPTVNALRPALGGYNDVFVAKIIEVPLAPTTTAVASSPNPSLTLQAVTFTATVTSSEGTPTGTVTFKDDAPDAPTLGTGTLNEAGQATLRTRRLRAGAHSITATYSGDGAFQGSTSSPIIQTVHPRR